MLASTCLYSLYAWSYFAANRTQSQTYINELNSFDEFVVAVEDEHWCKLPVPGWLAGLEVVLDLAAVQLVDVLECSEAVDGRPHLDLSLIHI